MASQHLHEHSLFSGELENQGGDFLPSGDGSSLTVTSNFMIQLSYLYMTTGKNIALTIWDFCQKSGISAFNNMLSRFVIAFLWELDHEEGWAPKNWCFRIVVLERTLESPLNNKEIKPSQSKGNQPWIFITRTDIEAAVLWLPDTNSQLIGKDPDAGKDWRQKAVTEDEMVGLYHWLNERKFVQTLGDGEGQGSLVCCSPWGHKESDTT